MKIKLGKNTKKVLFKTEEEWINARVIGGTTISAIMGKSKWQKRKDVYNQLALGKAKKTKANPRMLKGKKNEPIIAQLFATDFEEDYEVIEQPKGKYWLFYRKDKPHFTCTPDRLLINKKTGELEGLEIKDVELVKRADKDKWLNDEVPVQYILQCIWYFVNFQDMPAVTLYPHLHFYNYIDKQKVFDFSMQKKYVFYREDCEELIKQCEEKADEFWFNNIVKKVKPTD